MVDSGYFIKEKDIEIVAFNECWLMCQDPYAGRRFKINLGYNRFDADQIIATAPYAALHEFAHYIVNQACAFWNSGGTGFSYTKTHGMLSNLEKKYIDRLYSIAPKHVFAYHDYSEILTDAIVASLMNKKELESFCVFSKVRFEGLRAYRNDYNSLMRWALTCRMYSNLSFILRLRSPCV